MDDLPAPQLTLRGSLLADESWLAERVEQTGRQFRCRERRTNATLWWYSASAVLLGPAVRALVAGEPPADLSLPGLRFTLLVNGYLERVLPGPGSLIEDEVSAAASTGRDPAANLGRHLDQVLSQIIEPLARSGGATERALWAIAVDSLATRVLAETSARPGGSDRAPQIAEAVTDASPRLRPRPRYQDVSGRPESPPRRYVRRGSCCLLYRVPDGLCISCPKQTPAERLERLQRHARASG